MRYILSHILCAFVVAVACACSIETKDAAILFYRNGEQVELSAESQARIHAKILDTVRATGVDSTAYAGSVEKWNELAQRSHLLVTYDESRSVFAYQRQVSATGIVIPLSDDSHYLLRNSKSGEYWAFTKFLPDVRAELVCDPLVLVDENRKFCELWRERLGEA